jgi:ABC-type uncharacterized transport system substrate-binding protein
MQILDLVSTQFDFQKAAQDASLTLYGVPSPSWATLTAALQQATNTIPIVFVVVSDPVGSKFVTNIARPEANITGFMNVEPFLVEKWLELLMELAPRTARDTRQPDRRAAL